ncbi:MAG: hypothetical protein ABSB75_06505, partial [Candidatus Limnocylindrales bacterium]
MTARHELVIQARSGSDGAFMGLVELETAAGEVNSKTHSAVKSELREHSTAKAVNRVDGRMMKRKQRGRQSLPFVVTQALALRRMRGVRTMPGQDGFDRRADSRAQLGRRLFGKRHDQDLIEENGAGEEKVNDDMLNRKRLAGTGARVDNLVPAVENFIEDRGPIIFDVCRRCGRAHL